VADLRGATKASPGAAALPWATLVPWTVAAFVAVAAALVGVRYYLARAENDRLASERAYSDVAAKAADTRFEVEHLTSTRLASELAGLQQAAKRQLAEVEARRAAAEAQLAAARPEQSGGESLLARIRIAALRSPLAVSAKPIGVVAWDPLRNEGVLTVNHLEAGGDDRRFELWIVADEPVSAGQFSVGADGSATYRFKTAQPVSAAARFAVSRVSSGSTAGDTPRGEFVLVTE
jgi:hypothetical protein